SLGGAARMRKDALKGLLPGQRVLDVACGTGDLALDAAARVGVNGFVTGLDFAQGMLDVAEHRRTKELNASSASIDWVCQGAEALPLSGPKYDWVVSGFALRGLY